MSKTYLRLICNGEKIRSFCNTKWTRDLYLGNLSIDKPYNALSYDNKEKYLYSLLSQTPLHLKIATECFEYRIDIVRKGRTGLKRVIKSIPLKYKIYTHPIPHVYKLEETDNKNTHQPVHYIILSNRRKL